MRKRYIYISGFFIVVSIFSLVFAFSYQITKTRKQTVKSSPAPISQSSEQVATSSKERITDKTLYELEVLQVNTDQVVSQYETIPAEFAGKTREELVKYLDKYMENLPLEETLKGLIGYELMSFSKEKIVLRKTYQDLAKENKYYLTLVQDELVVYYNDKKSVYEYTGILKDELTMEEIAMLKIGYFVEGEEELFGILENYSS